MWRGRKKKREEKKTGGEGGMLWQWHSQEQDKILADVDLSMDEMNGRVGKTNLFLHEMPAQSPSQQLLHG